MDDNHAPNIFQALSTPLPRNLLERLAELRASEELIPNVLRNILVAYGMLGDPKAAQSPPPASPTQFDFSAQPAQQQMPQGLPPQNPMLAALAALRIPAFR